MSETLLIHISAEQIGALDMAPLQELRQLSAAALLELEDSIALQLELSLIHISEPTRP